MRITSSLRFLYIFDQSGLLCVRRQNFFPIIFNGTLEPLCFCALIGISTWINDNFKTDAFTQYVRKFELRLKVHKFLKLNSMLATLKVSQIWKRGLFCTSRKKM